MNTDLVLHPVAIVAEAAEDVRAAFLRRTYLHLGLAVLAFIAIEALLLRLPGVPALVRLMTGGYAWLVVLAAFIGVAHLADHWARADRSRQTQYLGLGLYVVAEAVIFLPLLHVAARYSSPEAIPAAAVITGLAFGGLTALALLSRLNFTVLRCGLALGGLLALGLIVASILGGVTLGLWFSAAMTIYAAGAILYETDSIQREYREDQHVAAALALFAVLALLFWYVLRFLIQAAAESE